MYKIEFVLGDWSDDGHGKYQSYLIESSVCEETLREIHFKSTEVLGFDIGKICSEYGVNWISRDFYEILQTALNWEIEEEDWEENEDKYFIESFEELLDIWLACLRKIDPTITLVKIEEKNYPTMHFYGYDKKGRHLNTPGYGLFR